MWIGRLSAAVLGVALSLSAASEGPDDVSTGLNAVLLHQQARARGLAPSSDLSPSAGKTAAAAPKNALVVPDRGDIAVVDDAEGVVLPAFLFDLGGRALDYLPQDAAATAYLYRVSDGGFDGAAAAQGKPVALDDDDSQVLELPFAFPFFGESYQSVYLNSDGNLTFGEADSASTARDPTRAVSGPPRICAFFTDLDPTQDDAAIRVFSSSDSVSISWINTPEWVDGGRGRLLTFQATLFRDGRIRVAYADIGINLGIIGLASGRDVQQSVAVDFSTPPTAPFTAAFVELFQPPDINFVPLLQKFYLSHEDAYDFVVIFHDFEIPLENAGFAFYLGIRNYVQGVGPYPAGFESENVFDFGQDLGSDFRLQGLIYMGDLDKYPADPAARIDRDEGVYVNTTLSILAHEAGHRFLTRTLFLDKPSGLYSGELLGRQGSHWSFFYNSDGSFMEGMRIVDHGPGAAPYRFESTEAFRRFGPMDLYLLGLIPPEQVPASFFVRNPDIEGGSFNPARQPLAGLLFNGDRVDISIDDIVETMGPRAPGPAISQKHYRYAFILLTEEGREPSAETIAKMERVRGAFSGYMAEQTDGGWQAQTELVKALTLDTWPAFGRLRGDPLQAAVFLGAPAEQDLTVRLDGGADLLTPESVMIPKGQVAAYFPLTGRQAGVHLMQAEIGEGYDTARSWIRVLDDARTLAAQRLYPFEQLIGDARERLQTGRVGQPMPLPYFLQVTDPDGLYYEHVRLRITASGDGSVSPANPVTDEYGTVLFDWTLAGEPGPNTLRIEAPGSDRPPLEIKAYGTIVPSRQRNRRIQLFEGP
ncbi:MAG: hypothetical protein GC160_25750 [Acidobacteria bacterium]|nr:hypothetical protein [Acidobacteriota bacterium]